LDTRQVTFDIHSPSVVYIFCRIPGGNISHCHLGETIRKGEEKRGKREKKRKDGERKGRKGKEKGRKGEEK
jgi:hypothetical protein